MNKAIPMPHNHSFPIFSEQHDNDFNTTYTANTSVQTTDHPHYTHFVYIWSVLFSLILLSNGSLLYLLITRRHLITSFTIYLFSILVANVLCWCVCMLPLEMVYLVSDNWWMGETACDLYLYGNWLLPGVITSSHALISITRIWAVIRPHSYRNVHTPRLAMALCAGVWISVHLFCLPLLVMDRSFFRQPTSGCRLNLTAQLWSEAYLTVIFYVADAIILLSFPLITYKTIQNSQQHAKLVSPEGGKAPLHYRSKSLVALTAMSVSIAVIWAPNHVVSIVTKYHRAELPDAVWQLLWVVYPLQAVVDPVLFALCLASIRCEVKRLVVKTKAAIYDHVKSVQMRTTTRVSTEIYSVSHQQKRFQVDYSM
ncbi:cysteinyl leukotriene receptor 1-like [Paramacrobiotus metropolitanus]|uniref:cysteinyl leukotriene receptor 1-like n=1 Tax=Paramacrobiotus metropolitanus TaxID=2943436 RepID=UPI002445CDAA|nr:cysteinyl leukotriene receptor 1-like [Paramacrobiotus metropolitanus]